MHTLCTPPSFRLPSARRNLPICFVDGSFSLHSTNGRKQKSRQKALLPRPSNDYRVQNKNASIVSILTFLYGGDGESRTRVRKHPLQSISERILGLIFEKYCYPGEAIFFYPAVISAVFHRRKNCLRFPKMTIFQRPGIRVLGDRLLNY